MKQSTSKNETQSYDSLGVDFKVGLENVQNKEELYKNILNKFYKNHQNANTKIINAIKKKKYELAKQLIHKIKGGAGIIGAGTLRKTAVELENSVEKKNEYEIHNQLKSFSNYLNKVLLSIKQFAKSKPDEILTRTKIKDTDLLFTLLTKLKPHVENFKPMDCKPIIKHMKSLLWPDKFQKQIDELCKLIIQYNFDEAYKSINTLIKQVAKE